MKKTSKKEQAEARTRLFVKQVGKKKNKNLSKAFRAMKGSRILNPGPGRRDRGSSS